MDRKSRRAAYEEDLQKAMLMSMGISGGSVMRVGDNSPRLSNTSRSASGSRRRGGAGTGSVGGGSNVGGGRPSGMMREDKEQLATATALRLLEQEARQGRSAGRSKG